MNKSISPITERITARPDACCHIHFFAQNQQLVLSLFLARIAANRVLSRRINCFVKFVIYGPSTVLLPRLLPI